MKYIIDDKQLFDAIYKFIDDMLTEDNIKYQRGYNYDTDKYDENLLNFYGDKYSDNEQDDWYFEYVSKEYYENLDRRDLDITKRWLDKSPLLELMDIKFMSKLDGFFSSFWKPVFEQWFRDKYPHLPVKTFVY